MARGSLEGGKVIPTSVPPTASDLAHEKWERVWERHLKALTNMTERDPKVLTALQRAMDKRRVELESFRNEVLESELPEDKKILLTSRVDSLEGTFRMVEDYVIKKDDAKGAHAAELATGIVRTESALQAYRKPYFDSFVPTEPAAEAEPEATQARTPDDKRATLRAMSDAAVAKAKAGIPGQAIENAEVEAKNWNKEVRTLYGALGTEKDAEARAAMRDMVSNRRRELEALRGQVESLSAGDNPTLAADKKQQMLRAIDNAEEAMDAMNGRVVEGTAVGEEARNMFTPLEHADLQLSTFRKQYLDPAPTAVDGPEAAPGEEAPRTGPYVPVTPDTEEQQTVSTPEPARPLTDYRAQMQEQLRQNPVPGQFARADAMPASSLNPLEKMTAEPFTKSEKKKADKAELMSSVSQLAMMETNKPRTDGMDLPPQVPVTEDGFRTNRIHERVSAQKEAMDKAIGNYAKMHGETYKKQGIFKKMFGAGRKAEGFEQDSVGKKAMDEVRLKYVNALDASVREELAKEGKTPEEIDKIAGRYMRMARLQQVTKPYLEAVRDARLDAREGSKGFFERTIGKYQKWEQGKEAKLAAFLEGKTFPGIGTITPDGARRSAQVIRKLSRVVGFATLGSAAVTVGGFFGVGAVGAGALGWLGTRVAGISLGSVAGWVSGDVYEETGGARAAGKLHEKTKELQEARVERAKLRAQAEAIADPKERQKKLNELDAADMAEFVALDEAARHGSNEAIQRKKILVENLTAAVASGSLTSLFSLDQTEFVSTGGAQGDITTDGNLSAGTSAPGAGADAAPGAADAASETAEVNPITAVTDRSVSIEGDVNNADRLIGRFGAKMQTAFGENPPPAIAKLNELLSVDAGDALHPQDQATLALNLQETDGSSAIMQPGDTIRLTDEGDIVIERPGKPEYTHVLIDRAGEIHTDHPLPMDGDGADATTAPATAPAAPQAPATPVEAPAAAAPAEQLAADAASTGDTSVAPRPATPIESAPTGVPSSVGPSVEMGVPPAEPTATGDALTFDQRPEGAAPPPPPAPEAPAAPTTPGGRQFESIDDYNRRYMGEAPAPIAEVTAAASFATGTANEIAGLPGWGNFQTANSWQFFREMPEAGTEAATVRRELMDVVRESGLGPRPEETLAQYLERADRALVDNPFGEVERVNGIDIVPGPAVYEDNNGRLVVHGGDYNARMLVAIDYLRDNASAELLVEDPGEDDYLEFSRENVARGNVPVSRTPVRGIRGFTERVF